MESFEAQPHNLSNRLNKRESNTQIQVVTIKTASKHSFLVFLCSAHIVIIILTSKHLQANTQKKMRVHTQTSAFHDLWKQKRCYHNLCQEDPRVH